MDDKSAERFAAYKTGNGAEYDDKIAGCDEMRRRRGEPSAALPDHSHSPVARLLARKKAQEAAKARAKTANAGLQGQHPHD
ncbi:MAG: hypothetical protein ACREQN_13410 [Candidatus Binataceae bacterium]